MQAVQIGVGMQVVCIVLPLLDLWLFGSVERHVQTAYPNWSATEIASDQTAIHSYLVAAGILGLLAWLGALWAIGRTWHARATITTLFVVGTVFGITNAGLGGDAYPTIVPLWLGITLLCIPLLPGLTALLSVWRRSGR